MSATTNTPALPAPLIVDYQATISKLTKAVKDYNAATGDVLAERVRQQHLHTLLRLWTFTLACTTRSRKRSRSRSKCSSMAAA
jgi:hypothetical protein